MFSVASTQGTEESYLTFFQFNSPCNCSANRLFVNSNDLKIKLYTSDRIAMIKSTINRHIKLFMRADILPKQRQIQNDQCVLCSNSSCVVWMDVLHQKKGSTRKEKDKWLKKNKQKKANKSQNLTQVH